MRAQLSQPLSAPQTTALESFLKDDLKDASGSVPEPDNTFRYLAASVSLRDGPPPQILVYIEGHYWCGSGGCPLLILSNDKGGLHIITETTVTQLPIRVLRHTTNGWHDIAVLVGGGGIIDGYEVTLRFNGRKYPSNPTLQGRYVRRKDDGIELFTQDSVPVALYR
jgi:hypothetical protein